MPFFDNGISKSAPNPTCFVHFHLKMRFAPQRRGIFEHENFKNRARHQVFLTLWLANVLRATEPCHFSSVCWTATSAPAALARLLFEHQEPRIIEKTAVRDIPNIWRVCIFFLDSRDSTRVLIFFPLTWLLCYSAFQLSLLSEVRLLNFLRLTHWLTDS